MGLAFTPILPVVGRSCGAQRTPLGRHGRRGAFAGPTMTSHEGGGAEGVLAGAQGQAVFQRGLRGYVSGYRSELRRVGDETAVTDGVGRVEWSGEGVVGGEGAFELFVEQALAGLFGVGGLNEDERQSLEVYVGRLRASGDVREFLREVCKTEAFRKRYFDNVSNLRFVELIFKKLLGRAPADGAEMAEHMQRVNFAGFEAELDALIDSSEYTARFGCIALSAAGTGAHAPGPRGFATGMKLLTASRPGRSDATVPMSLLGPHLRAASPAPAPAEIRAGYLTLRPSYPPANYMALPRSTLLTNWAAIALVPAPAVASWSGLGSPRPTGPADQPWAPGWRPAVSGREVPWSDGWAPAGKTKSYV